MALIVDPDQLSQATEVTIDTSTLTIELNLAGNLSEDGVTMQALYSFLKEEWRSDATKIPFPFPMVAITPEQFEFVDDWEPADDATRKLLRTGGWREIAPNGSVKREYAGIITLGNIDATSKTVGDKAYYAFSTDTSATEFTYAGPVNEAIQTYGDASNGNFDKRTNVLTVYIRQQGKLYGQQTSTQIGVTPGTSLGYIARRYPLSEATDLNIVADDTTISTTAPYTGMSITYFATPQSSSSLFTSDLQGGPYNFGIVIDGNGGTSRQIYEFVQWSLRQSTNIDEDITGASKPGVLQDALLRFVGSQLETLSATNVDGGGTGVAIVDFNSNDTNSLTFTDNTGAARNFPFVAAGTITFNSNLVSDGSAVYRMFFTTLPGAGNDFGQSGAVLVNDNSGTPISGTVTGSTVSFDFDYDGNNQGGRTPGTDADVTIVAIGLGTAQYVAATGTITRATGLNFSLVAALERNYANL
jgi:hypothetical protein